MTNEKLAAFNRFSAELELALKELGPEVVAVLVDAALEDAEPTSCQCEKLPSIH